MESTYIMSFRNNITLELDPAQGCATVTVGVHSGPAELAIECGKILYGYSKEYTLTDAQLKWLDSQKKRIRAFNRKHG